MQPQPLIAVSDVPASSKWYQSVLGCESGHGGVEYDQLVYEGTLIMQLHHWDAHEHPYLGEEDSKPYGNGVVLWFRTEDIEAAQKRAQALSARFLEEMKVNPSAQHREFWLRDPDGYVVVIAGPNHELGALRAK